MPQEAQSAVRFQNMEGFHKIHIWWKTKKAKVHIFLLTATSSYAGVIIHGSMWNGTQCSYFHLLQPSCQFKHLPPLKCALREASGAGRSCATSKPLLQWTVSTGYMGGEKGNCQRRVMPRLWQGVQIFRETLLKMYGHRQEESCVEFLHLGLRTGRILCR